MLLLATGALAMPGLSGAPLAQTAPEVPGLWQRDTLTGDWGGLRPRLVNSGFTFALQQQSELG
jgi:porin